MKRQDGTGIWTCRGGMGARGIAVTDHESDSHLPTIVSFRNKLKEGIKKRNIKNQNIDI